MNASRPGQKSSSSLLEQPTIGRLPRTRLAAIFSEEIQVHSHAGSTGVSNGQSRYRTKRKDVKLVRMSGPVTGRESRTRRLS